MRELSTTVGTATAPSVADTAMEKTGRNCNKNPIISQFTQTITDLNGDDLIDFV